MKLLLLTIMFAIILSGCVAQYNTDIANQPTETPEEIEQPQAETQVSSTSHQGEVIAGETTKYIRYSKSDYEKALAEDKAVYLYFYANWCPICRAERPSILQAFNEMNAEDAIGFEVHYNDNEVTNDDKTITKGFGISYQHTTIILDKDGNEVFRSLSPISKDMIKVEINKARGL